MDEQNMQESVWDSKAFLASLVSIFATLVVAGIIIFFWRTYSRDVVKEGYAIQVQDLRTQLLEKNLEIGRLQNQVSCLPSLSLLGDTFINYVHHRTAFIYNSPTNLIAIKSFSLKNVPCYSNQTVSCDVALTILANKDWQEKGASEQTFYFSEDVEGSPIYYGPFRDNLERLLKESEKL